MLDNLNVYTDSQYKDVINRTKIKTQISFLLEQRNYYEIKKGIYKEYYLALSFKRKLIIFMDQFSPFLSRILRVVKRRVSVWTSI